MIPFSTKTKDEELNYPWWSGGTRYFLAFMFWRLMKD